MAGYIMTLRIPLALSALALAIVSTSKVNAQPFDYDVTADNYSQYFGAANVPKDTTVVKDNGSWVLLEFNKGGDSSPEVTLNHRDNSVSKDDYTYVYVPQEQGTHKFQTIWTVSTLKAMLGKNVFQMLRNDMGLSVSDIRSAVNEVCPPVLEVGKTSVYGAPFSIDDGNVDYIAELDTDTKHCNNRNANFSGDDVNGEHEYALNTSGNPANVRIKSIVPTVPGATYVLQVKYQKRSTSSRDVGDLVVRVGGKLRSVNVAGIPSDEYDNWDVDGQRVVLPSNPSNAGTFDQNNLEKGFYKGRIIFKATRFNTPIHFRDNGTPDSYGILLRGSDVDLKDQNPAFEWCSNFFEPNSKNLKACLEQENPEQSDLFSCNFQDALLDPKYVKQEGSSDNVGDIFAAKGELGPDNYYIVGMGGKLGLKLPGAGCQIYNKTLNLNEFTNKWPTENFAGYPEQGTVKAVLKCLDEDGMSKRNVVALTKVEDKVMDGFTPKDRKTLLRTNQSISYKFDHDDYQSCRLVALNIKDTTSKIKRPDGQPSQVSTNGFEIQGLSITED